MGLTEFRSSAKLLIRLLKVVSALKDEPAALNQELQVPSSNFKAICSSHIVDATLVSAERCLNYEPALLQSLIGKYISQLNFDFLVDFSLLQGVEARSPYS